MSYAGTTPQYQNIKIDNIEIDNNVVYFGDKDTDGSFRLFKDGTDLKIQVRDTGAWVDKDVINP
jgi:hypothetical protein